MYVAPEVLGFSGGFMIDWWSLGVLVYELLTGSPPWNTKVVESPVPVSVSASLFDHFKLFLYKTMIHNLVLSLGVLCDLGSERAFQADSRDSNSRAPPRVSRNRRLHVRPASP
jgi:serine/threonine protein kinase